MTAELVVLRRDLDVQSRHFMERIEVEALWLGCPAFADELIGREPLQRLQTPAEVVG